MSDIQCDLVRPSVVIGLPCSLTGVDHTSCDITDYRTVQDRLGNVLMRPVDSCEYFFLALGMRSVLAFLLASSASALQLPSPKALLHVEF